MTGDTIEASYLWTEDEYVRLQDAHRETKIRPAYRRALYLLFALVLVFLVWRSFRSPAIMPGMVFFVTCPLVFLVMDTVGRRLILRRAFRKAGAAAEPDQKITLVIDPHRVRLISAATDSSWAWEVVTKVAEVRDGFILYRGGFMNWLPHHAFLTPDGRERFAALARERAAQFVSVVG